MKNKKLYEKTELALGIINKFCAKGIKNPDQSLIRNIISKCVSENKPIELISFTCSTIDSNYMYDSKNFEKYVSLDPTGNNLTSNISTINELSKELAKVNQKIKLIVLIGNTDPYYVYSQQISVFKNLSKEKYFLRFNKRWEKYKTNLDKWLKKQKMDCEYDVVSWYEFEKNWESLFCVSFENLYEKVYLNLEKYFSQEDLDWELNKLKENFGENKYFGEMRIPKLNVLKDWVRRKFAMYATQGLWIKWAFPYSLLLQNEKPTDLRYKMYQPLISEIYTSTMPNLFIYGIDNSGYL